MRWHSPRRFGTEADDILVVTRDGLDEEDCHIVIGYSLCGAFAIFFASIPSLTGPRPDEVDFWLLAAAIGCTVIVSGARWFRRYRGSLGCWRIEPDAIEFAGARGPVRRLEWAEVTRIRRFRLSFKLEGPSGTIELTRGGLPDDAWGRVRAAVEAALTPRFDLAEPIPEPKPRWSRLAIASLPPCVLVGGEALLMRDWPRHRGPWPGAYSGC